MLRDSLVKLLEGRAHTIVVARETLAALALMRAGLEPDLILADWRMTHGGGEKLIRALRAAAETKNTPVIVLTGDVGVELPEDAVTRVVSKPFEVDNLVSAIQAFCPASLEAPAAA